MLFRTHRKQTLDRLVLGLIAPAHQNEDDLRQANDLVMRIKGEYSALNGSLEEARKHGLEAATLNARLSGWRLLAETYQVCVTNRALPRPFHETPAVAETALAKTLCKKIAAICRKADAYYSSALSKPAAPRTGD